MDHTGEQGGGCPGKMYRNLSKCRDCFAAGWRTSCFLAAPAITLPTLREAYFYPPRESKSGNLSPIVMVAGCYHPGTGCVILVGGLRDLLKHVSSPRICLKGFNSSLTTKMETDVSPEEL